MPTMIRWLLPTKMLAITLPPFGMYANHDQLDDPVVLAHEQVHWAQYERMGVLRFYVTYLWQWAWYGYEQHPMEVEARESGSSHERHAV